MSLGVTLIDSQEITTSTASVTLTGMTSLYKVYQLYVIMADTGSNGQVRVRFQEGGTTNSSSIYDRIGYQVWSGNSGISDIRNAGLDAVRCNYDSSHRWISAQLTIINSQDSTEYTYVDAKGDAYLNGENTGFWWNFNFKNNSVIDGLYIFDSVGNNYTSGSFYLYGVK